MSFFVLLVLFGQFYLIHGVIKVDPLVETNVGPIKGLHALDGGYVMFLGIPYAQVDENDPFGPSRPHAKFDYIFNAIDDSITCPQELPFKNTVNGSLSCLQLSVYVPSIKSSANSLPVMVWIHGGAFFNGHFGRNFYDPIFLVRHEVIVVTINYRLGPYGFMCLNIPEVPGNQGLKDQLIALKWIKENIGAFGGDEENITLFGENAGAVSADLHLRFNKERLFAKVILQSGSASAPWAIAEPDLEYSIKLAKLLSYDTDDVHSSLEYLKTVDPLVLIETSLKLNTDLKPCPEKDFDGVEKFIADYALNIKIPRADTTPILLGFNSKECLFYFINIDGNDFKVLDKFNENLNMGFYFSPEEQFKMIDLIKRFYFGDREMSKAVEAKLAEFVTDFMFIHPMTRSIAEYLNDGASKIYQYAFSYDGGRNLMKVMMNNTRTDGGAFHSDELGYLFNHEDLTKHPNQRDRIMIGRLTTLWTNFAKYGNPTPAISDLVPLSWPTVTPHKYRYLNIGDTLSMHSRPYHQRMAFWDLFYAMNEHKRKGYKHKEEILIKK